MYAMYFKNLAFADNNYDEGHEVLVESITIENGISANREEISQDETRTA